MRVEPCCEICGKEILHDEKAVKISAGRRNRGLLGYFKSSNYAITVAHFNCLELEKTNLKEDKEVSFSSAIREAAFKLAEVKLTEVDKE